MLLGEFDFIDTILENPHSTWVTKLLFSVFLLGMSIVLMNLVVGLAISDISALRLAMVEELMVALRHEAHIRKTISLMMAIEATEQLAEDVEAIQVDISEAISEFTEELKEKLLSAEVREALDTIQYLIGRLYWAKD